MGEISGKSDSKAEQLYSQGNELFEAGNYFEALVAYNKSLCYSESNRQKALSYGNRSAVFFTVKMYPQCLNNIRLARENNYPREELLVDREEKCLKLMESENIEFNKSTIREFFKLSYEPNPKIPCIIDGLELRPDEKFGRGIFTTRPLKVGDIICMEEPFASSRKLSREDDWSKYCGHCFQSNLLDLISCSKCIFAMFCNDKCKEFHHNHCVTKRHDAWKHPTAQYGLIPVRFLSALDDSHENFETMLNDCKENPKTIFDYDFSDPDDQDYEKNRLTVALSLPCKNFVTVEEEIGFQQLLSTPAEGKHLLKVSQHLANFVSTYEKVTFGYDPQMFHILLFNTLINHSCNPNIRGLQVGGKVCLFVVRPIEDGEQLFFCHHESYANQPLKERRSGLLEKKIECSCEACEKPDDFPFFFGSKRSNNLELLSAISKYSIPSKLKPKETIATVQQLAEALQLGGKDHTSREYLSAVALLIACFLELAAPPKFQT